jgi:AAA domain
VARGDFAQVSQKLSMKFIVIFGPPAVGKMTVGHELAKLTGLKLFHNHMSIDLALNFFDYGQGPFNRLVTDFRRRIFEEVAASDLPGLIFTYVWALNLDSDKAYVDQMCAIFRERGATIYFVELAADLAERLRRNETQFRLSQKPSKRNVEESRELLLKHEKEYRFNTEGDFYYPESHLKLETTNLSASETARRIVDAFKLLDLV